MNLTRMGLRPVLALTVAGAMVLAACTADGANDPTDGAGGNGDDDLSGTIFVSGSSTVEPISLANAEKFSDENPNLQISVEGPGTSDGFAVFCDGGSDISDASRAIKQEEVEICADNGIEFVELEVGIDGLSVITSTSNDQIDCLSFLDLYALLGPESQGFANWSDANDLAAELEGELGEDFGTSNAPYPDVPLEVTAPGEESGTFDSFVEIALEAIADARGEDATTRPDYQASHDDNVIVEGISGSDTSLGWVGYAFASNNSDVVRALPIDGGDGCVEPSAETVQDGTYTPLGRPLFIYPSAEALQKPEVVAFIEFYLENQEQITEEATFISMNDEQLAESQDEVAALAG